MRPAKAMSTAAKLISKTTTEDPELAARFNRVLGQTVEAMEASGLKYVFIGGIASGGLGRPRSTHDIDLFVKPEDAQLALQALARFDFRTEKTDPSWLYKGFKEDILVDVIFKSKGEIYLDAEMYQRSQQAEFHGKQLRLVAPEDLLIIKAAAHSELTPGHWHDATALLSHASLDWDYLIRRARRAPRRVLSLLLYAQSNDIWVPNFVVSELYQGIFGDASRQMPQPHQQAYQMQGQGGVAGNLARSQTGARQTHTHAPLSVVPPAAHERASEAYAIGHLRERLAEDPRTNELDIEIEQAQDRLLLRGEVSVPERRQTVEKIAHECFPNYDIENQIRVIHFSEPSEAEEIE
jgi:predicted nucleotidyltransferase